MQITKACELGQNIIGRVYADAVAKDPGLALREDAATEALHQALAENMIDFKGQAVEFEQVLQSLQKLLTSASHSIERMLSSDELQQQKQNDLLQKLDSFSFISPHVDSVDCNAGQRSISIKNLAQGGVDGPRLLMWIDKSDLVKWTDSSSTLKSILLDSAKAVKVHFFEADNSEVNEPILTILDSSSLDLGQKATFFDNIERLLKEAGFKN